MKTDTTKADWINRYALQLENLFDTEIKGGLKMAEKAWNNLNVEGRCYVSPESCAEEDYAGINARY
jgi:hypothetical protein